LKYTADKYRNTMQEQAEELKRLRPLAEAELAWQKELDVQMDQMDALLETMKEYER
jgi:hypothetical protein